MAAHPGRLTRYFAQVFLALLMPDIVHSLQEYEFSALCTFSSVTNIDLRYQSSVLVTLDWVNYMSNMDCKMKVSAKSSYRISVKFIMFDLHCSDSLTLKDGNLVSSLLNHGTYCGPTEYSEFTTNGNDLDIELKTDSSNDGQGFKLLITAFKTGYCDTDNKKEFKCNNGRCIDFELYCNSEDNCGDNSDSCYMDEYWWVWVIVGIVVFIVICVIITVICCCCCKKSRPGTVVSTNPGVAVHYNAGMQTAGTTTISTTPGVNPWYGPQSTQPQYQPQNAYLPPQGSAQPSPFSAPPPSYTSISGAPVYPPNQQVNPNWPAPDPVLAAEKSAL